MKKVLLALLIITALLLSSCGSGDDSTDTSGSTGVSENVIPSMPENNAGGENSTETAPTLDEMSPATADVSLPFEIAHNTSELDFDSFEKIKAKKSQLPKSDCKKILKSENAEYFFMDDDGKILAIFVDESNIPVFSASYDMGTGILQYLGDDTRSWYFNDDNTLNCFVYTYYFGYNNPGIYTFYTPDGTRDFIRTYNGNYSADLFPLTDDESLTYYQKYSRTSEIIAEY